MKQITICLILLSITFGKLVAQDPMFSQPYANPLYLNPAFAGTDTVQRIGLNFRDQWPNIPGNFITYSISYDRNIINSNISIGVLADQDIAGQTTITRTSASLILAYQLHIKSFTLNAAFQGGGQEAHLNTSNLAFGDMIDPRRGFVYNTQEIPLNTTVLVPDFSAGILGYGKYYFAGFAIDHLTQPNESFVAGPSPLPIKITLNAGGIIPIGKIEILPTFLYLKQQDLNAEVAECYVRVWHLTVGLGYRFGDAMIFGLGFQSKYLRVGYSYDYTVSKLTNATGGSHEASLAVLFPYRSSKLKKAKGINSPYF